MDNNKDDWYCYKCQLPPFSTSFFEDNDTDRNSSIVHTESVSNDTIIFDDIRHDNPRDFIAAYLNINSVRHKIIHIREALKRTPVDILGIAETKIDHSFPDSQFMIDGYRLFRHDRDDKGGGLMVYIRSDIPCRRITDYEANSVELLVLEVLPKHDKRQTKWVFINAYKPPKISNGQFTGTNQLL
jgi:hypothetical protein